jgi:O-antigen/teichoic acid export membrane protein
MKEKEGTQSSGFGLLHIPSRLRKSSFIRNTLVVMSGTTLAQVLGAALYPIIGRLYSPSDFGVFGSFNAVLGIVAAGITLNYSLALMLPKKRDDAFGLFILSCICTTIISAGCLVICVVAPTFVRGLLKAPNNWILGMLVIGITINGLNQACQAWSVRIKAFKYTSASQVIRSLSTNGAQCGLGYLKGGAPALIITSIFGDLLATLNLAKLAIQDLRELRKHVHWNRIWQLAKEYRDFPVYSASDNVINALSLGLPVFLLAHYYGIAVAGAYAFGLRILRVPMEFILRALRQVLYQKASETHNEGGRLMPLYVKTTAGLFILALFPAVVALIWAPDLFTWVFGNQWRLAGVFARGLVIWLVFAFCNLPAIQFARIVRMQRQMFFYDQAMLILRSVTLIAGGLYLPASYTVMLFSIVGAIMNAILIFMIGFALVRKEGDIDFRQILISMREG